MLLNIVSSRVRDLSRTISDALTKRSFWVILKITISNLSKPLHNIVIIQFLTYTFGLKTIDRKEETTKKCEYLKNQRSVLCESPIGLQLY